ncbi:hypothetical protein VFPPC_15144 [Pochonia chlamydosporia 170]|uniref:Uncharacterized protein n=1 Tax=Pochonia chlamydosporia 170 TaxID=1380566 RepID=A0A179G4N4_METCM|nr:hypothetical protein VFPPC_15144 [Pochonia chlamydosporia 170]OAQ72480.1 hypothetical protein VFPPC_15144 [Pochonia chlamydosporia 170]
MDSTKKCDLNCTILLSSVNNQELKYPSFPREDQISSNTRDVQTMASHTNTQADIANDFSS